MKKLDSTATRTSPLILLMGGDYWHKGFIPLDKQDRGRDNRAILADAFDKSQGDEAVINQGILLEALPPLNPWGLANVVAPLGDGRGEARTQSFLLSLLAKYGAPQTLGDITHHIYYQSSPAASKGGLVVMRTNQYAAMVYDEAGGLAKGKEKTGAGKLSPFIQPAGDGWQVVRARGKKTLTDFLSAFVAVDQGGKQDSKTNGQFYSLAVLTRGIHILHQPQEALFFLPRSASAPLLCHLAMVAAVKNDNRVRVKIAYS